LIVAYSCAIENGDAHRKNFSVTYGNPEGVVRFAPGYDILSTTPYIPRDTLALTLNDTKQFATRRELIRFIRFVTARSERAAIEILDKVAHGVDIAIREAHQYAEEYPDGRRFVDGLTKVLMRGQSRLAA
jgi:serine/threonine-protein kinase HipA